HQGQANCAICWRGFCQSRSDNPKASIRPRQFRSPSTPPFATTVPELLTNDITSSQTLSPMIPRETFASPPSLGYHYPVVDSVLNGATVNNCTLNINQGAILPYTS